AIGLTSAANRMNWNNASRQVVSAHRRIPQMDTLLQDVRFGVRQLRKSPAFTAAAVLTLALGIGANATVFTWLKAVIFNPLPGVDAGGLVSVRWRSPEGNAVSFSRPQLLDLSKQPQV